MCTHYIALGRAECERVARVLASGEADLDVRVAGGAAEADEFGRCAGQCVGQHVYPRRVASLVVARAAGAAGAFGTAGVAGTAGFACCDGAAVPARAADVAHAAGAVGAAGTVCAPSFSGMAASVSAFVSAGPADSAGSAGPANSAAAPALDSAAPGISVCDLTWGFQVPGHTDLVFNTRIESAARGTRLWSRPLREGRAVACAHAFFETHRTQSYADGASRTRRKMPYRFESACGGILLFAALCEQGRFSILTEDAREQVAPIHPRMPLMLSAHEAVLWLNGELPAFLNSARAIPELIAAPEYPVDPVPEQLSLF